jgi:hypothetical protein
MTLLAHIENVIATYEAKILQLQQEIQILRQQLEVTKGLNPKKDNKK